MFNILSHREKINLESPTYYRLFSRFLLMLSVIFLTGCATNYIFEPSRRGLTTKEPGEQWHPPRDLWYCPRSPAPSIPISALLPEDDCELDVAGLLNIALSNHPLTRQAWAKARAQAFAVGAAESFFYPTIVGTENLEYNNTTGGGVSSAGSGIIAGGGTGLIRSSFSSATIAIVSDITLSYLLLDFGGREASVRAEEYALQSLNWTENRTIQQVIISVMQGYYNYIDAYQTQIAKKADLENAQMNLDATEELHTAGIVRQLDYLQAKANLENAILALVTAEAQVKINLVALAVALGIPPTTALSIKDLPEYFPVEEVTTNLDALLAIAQRDRPDLAAAYATIFQQKMSYIVAASASLPTLSTNVDMQQVTFLKRTGTSGHNYLGVLSLNIPIFNGFLFDNQRRQAKENIKVAQANFDNLETLALLDVVTGYYNYISAKENLEYSQNFLNFAQEAYDVALSTYRNGTASILDLLSAYATLSNARAQRIDARTKWAISVFTIAYATGHLDSSFVEQQLFPERCYE